MMAFRIVTGAAIAGSVAGTVNLAIEDCGDGATHGHVEGINPSAVNQGHKTLVQGSGHLDSQVTDGDYKVNVKALGVSMQRCHADLCGASKCALPAFTGHVDFRGLACPQAPGFVIPKQGRLFRCTNVNAWGFTRRGPAQYVLYIIHYLCSLPFCAPRG